MLRYILLRLGYFALTFVAVSMAIFALSRLAPGDAVDKYLDEEQNENMYQDYASYIAQRKKLAEELYLDLPPFYLSLTSSAIPKKLYTIPSKKSRSWYKQLIYKYRTSEQAWEFIDQIQKLELLANQESKASFINLKKEIAKIKYKHDPKILNNFKAFLGLLKLNNQPKLAELHSSILTSIDQLFLGAEQSSKASIFRPKVIWHGFDNQYHHWFANFISGNFGVSDFDRRPVKSRIWEAVGWTMLINIISIFLAFLISIPFGVNSADRMGSRYDRTISMLSMMLYALPAFWVATLSITFFASDDWLHWFPSGGLGRGNNTGFSRMLEVGYHLILPILCVTYIALAFIIRQVRGAMKDTLDKEFIKTAQAKGLDHKEILWKHGFRNSLIPLVTMFSSVLPATIAGSVVVEIIFSIPGMGRLAFNGILQQDWNIVFTILLLGTFLTLLGNLLADLLYLKVDPRITFTKDLPLGV